MRQTLLRYCWEFQIFLPFCSLVLTLVLIASFTKMQTSCQKNYFEGALSMRKGASERFYPPPPQPTLASYATVREQTCAFRINMSAQHKIRNKTIIRR